jgi:raffinose/stachyose/melibiose transport system substrate-binding protein
MSRVDSFEWPAAFRKEQAMSTGKFDSNAFSEQALDNLTFNNKVYGLPLGLSLAEFWYNKDLFAKFDLKAPMTWDEFLNVFDKLKKNKVIPIALVNQSKWLGAYYLMYLADRLEGPDLFNSTFQLFLKPHVITILCQ